MNYSSQTEEYKEEQYQLYKQGNIPFPGFGGITGAMTVDFAKREFRDNPKAREFPSKVKEHPPFDYDRYDFFTKDTVPRFVLSILNDPYIPDEQKHRFVNHFLYDY